MDFTRKIVDESKAFENDQLTKIEFTRIIQKVKTVVGGPLLKKDDLEALFDLLDENSDQKISKREFEILMEKIVEIVKEEDKNAYQKMISYGSSK